VESQRCNSTQGPWAVRPLIVCTVRVAVAVPSAEVPFHGRSTEAISLPAAIMLVAPDQPHNETPESPEWIVRSPAAAAITIVHLSGSIDAAAEISGGVGVRGMT
jgi:hypothetical protein